MVHARRRRVCGAEGLEPPPPPEDPAEIWPNLIAVTILANPETLDIADSPYIQKFKDVMLSGGSSWLQM